MPLDIIIESSGDKTAVYTRETVDDVRDVVMQRFDSPNPVVFLGFFQVTEILAEGDQEAYRETVKVADAERRFEKGVPIYTMQLYNLDGSKITEYHQYLGEQEVYYNKFLVALMTELKPFGLIDGGGNETTPNP